MSHMCLMNSAAGAKKKIILDNLLKLELFYCGIRERERGGEKSYKYKQKIFHHPLFFVRSSMNISSLKTNKKRNEYRKAGKRRGLMCAIENF